MMKITIFNNVTKRSYSTFSSYFTSKAQKGDIIKLYDNNVYIVTESKYKSLNYWNECPEQWQITAKKLSKYHKYKPNNEEIVFLQENFIRDKLDCVEVIGKMRVQEETFIRKYKKKQSNKTKKSNK